jgi:AraC family transcriptional regulator
MKPIKYLAKMVKKPTGSYYKIIPVSSNKRGKQMNYEDRINKVIDFIGLNIDSELTLEQLSEVACFSKHHFHRLFTAYVGLSLQQYIKWLRLKRAAYQLNAYKDRKIIDIALSSGYESHESFARSFKKSCGVTPNDFRKKANWDLWNKPPYSLQTRGRHKMNVTIKHIPAKRLAILEHRGDYNKLGETVDRMRNWIVAQTVDLRPKPDTRYGFAYNDPRTTEAEDFRFDIAVAVPNLVKIDGEIKEQSLPEGRYAVAIHKGARINLGDTIDSMYADWLPSSGEELADLPCVFCFQNLEQDVADTELITDVMLLLK